MTAPIDRDWQRSLFTRPARIGDPCDYIGNAMPGDPPDSFGIVRCGLEAGHEGKHLPKHEVEALERKALGVIVDMPVEPEPEARAGSPELARALDSIRRLDLGPVVDRRPVAPADRAELRKALASVAECQAEYEKARKAHREAVANVDAISETEPAAKVAALSRIMARGGVTKTDAPKYVHEDEHFSELQGRIARAKQQRDERDDELSIARQRLNSARVIVLGFSTLINADDIEPVNTGSER